MPYLVKAMDDRNNLDAFIQCAFLCPTLDESVECLEGGIRNGDRYIAVFEVTSYTLDAQDAPVSRSSLGLMCSTTIANMRVTFGILSNLDHICAHCKPWSVLRIPPNSIRKQRMR